MLPVGKVKSAPALAVASAGGSVGSWLFSAGHLAMNQHTPTVLPTAPAAAATVFLLWPIAKSQQLASRVPVARAVAGE